MASTPGTSNSWTPPDTDQIVSLRGERELVRRAGDLFTGAREEFLCAAADLVTFSPGVNAAFAGGRRPPLVPGGLTMRKLYTPRALADAASEARLVRIAESGAEVRISTAPLAHEAIVIDRRVAILAGAPVRGVRTFTVIRTPVAVEGVRALVYAAWETATDLDEYRRTRPPVLGEEARRVLRALGAGHTDEVTARELGMSLRTYRRRVAEVMATLGATSRFQAGLRARELDFGIWGGVGDRPRSGRSRLSLDR
ncbi:DNA-binding response regulator [Streptomyces sp. NPDC018029]|uniref:DNA-binding response regulator n=1 Tax=Streptomyces sp. NPDC018029 TaxID=3365032 RepID=UPI0037B0E16F